ALAPSTQRRSTTGPGTQGTDPDAMPLAVTRSDWLEGTPFDQGSGTPAISRDSIGLHRRLRLTARPLRERRPNVTPEPSWRDAHCERPPLRASVCTTQP